MAAIETQLAKAKEEDTSDGVLAYSRAQTDIEDDCRDEQRHHFRGDR
ncbi:hypothetical protein [Streptomyces sp. NPDC057302]